MADNLAELLVIVVGPFAGAIIGIILVVFMVFALFGFFYEWFEQE